MIPGPFHYVSHLFHSVSPCLTFFHLVAPCFTVCCPLNPSTCWHYCISCRNLLMLSPRLSYISHILGEEPAALACCCWVVWVVVPGHSALGACILSQSPLSFLGAGVWRLQAFPLWLLGFSGFVEERFSSVPSQGKCFPPWSCAPSATGWGSAGLAWPAPLPSPPNSE